MTHMGFRFFCQRIFSDRLTAFLVPQDLGADPEAFRTVIGISGIFQIQRCSDHRHIGIGKNGKQSFLHNSVKSTLLIEQQHSVPVKIPQIVGQLSTSWKISIGIDCGHKFIIGIRIIKTAFSHTAGIENALQLFPGKRAYHTALRIIFNAGKPAAQMIFLASGKIFQSVFVLNGNHDPAVRCQMLLQDLKEILVRRLAAYVSLSVLKNTDQTDIVIVCGKFRFHIREIAHMDRHIFTFTVAVGVDQAALLREIHTGHFPGFSCQCTRDGSASTAHFQHFLCFLYGKEIHDIFPESRQMIQDRPALSLRNDPVIFHRTVFFYNV